MRTRRTSVGWRRALALGGATLLVAALGGAAARADGSQGAQTIKSGAGPGWPKTLQPSDFVRRVDNPWLPFVPGNKWRYRGVDTSGRLHDNERVTHRRARIEGVRVTPVHDVVRKDGKPREISNDFYAQGRHGNIWYFGGPVVEPPEPSPPPESGGGGGGGRGIPTVPSSASAGIATSVKASTAIAKATSQGRARALGILPSLPREELPLSLPTVRPLQAHRLSAK